MPLTDKQERFCTEYQVDQNGTQAAIRAGYAEGSARQSASDLMSKPAIQARMAELAELQRQRTNITADRVLAGLWDIASDPDTPAAARVQAYDKIARHLRMYDDKASLDGELVIKWQD